MGLDLGQLSDYTALSALEWEPYRPPPPPPPYGGPKWDKPGWSSPHTEGSKPLAPCPSSGPVYYVRTLKRWPLGTAYTEIVNGLVKFLRTPTLENAVLVVDQTGVGAPVVEMVAEALRRERVKVSLCGVTITAGHEVHLVGRGRWTVPKKTLASVLQVLLQNRRLRVAPELSDAETLTRELLAFRVKVSTATAHESFESWRERDHDDLVLAVALAAWAAETLDLDPTPALAPTILRAGG